MLVLRELGRVQMPAKRPGRISKMPGRVPGASGMAQVERIIPLRCGDGRSFI